MKGIKKAVADIESEEKTGDDVGKIIAKPSVEQQQKMMADIQKLVKSGKLGKEMEKPEKVMEAIKRAEKRHNSQQQPPLAAY